MFGRNRAARQPVATAEPVVKPGGKGRPTPKRREAELRHHRPLGSPTRATLRAGATKEEKRAARAAERSKLAAERALMRQALVTGDERHLPSRDKGPARRFVRDYVDARRNAGELFIPVALVILAASLIPIGWVQLGSLVALYTMVLLVIVDSVVLRRRLARITVDKFGDKAPGAATYGMMRALQIRRTRLPKAQVRRGEYPS